MNRRKEVNKSIINLSKDQIQDQWVIKVLFRIENLKIK